MQHEALNDAAWSALRAKFPAGLNLDDSARACGAFPRPRGVPDAASLLRLALSYGACGLSLRSVAAWAEACSVARVSDVALLNRLRNAAPWLEALVAALLSAQLAPAGRPGAVGRVRVVDATTLSGPGSRRTDWRVHVSYDLAGQRIAAVEVSDGRGAESLRRFAFGAGDIALGDRGYAKAGDLAAVVAGESDFLVRIGWNALRLLAADGAPFDLLAAVDGLPEGGTAAFELAVALDRGNRERLPVRVIARRKSAAEAERSRRHARRRSRKQGKTIKQETLRAAEYVFLVTSLATARLPADEALALYRLRWQIELAFKRLKSLLGLGDLPARDPGLARSWIAAKLIAALLIEDGTRHLLDSSP